MRTNKKLLQIAIIRLCVIPYKIILKKRKEKHRNKYEMSTDLNNQKEKKHYEISKFETNYENKLVNP